MNKIVRKWESRGRYLDVFGRKIFVWEKGAGRPLLALHGFPSSSFDWRHFAERAENRRFVALDFPGFGLSDKSPEGVYSLFAYADVVEEVARQLGIEECDLIAHDMGDSVAAELLARSNEGKLSFRIDKCVLLNGSIFLELARLTRGQKLFARMKPKQMRVRIPLIFFRSQIRRTFSSSHLPSHFQTRMLLRLLAHDGGARLLPVTIRYLEERKEHEGRWIDALVAFPGPLSLVWGDRDPIAVPEMTERLLRLRPDTACVRWSEVGHWPHMEVPDRLADKVGRFLS